MIEDFDLTLKCIVVGDGQVGKTSLITRYAYGTFTEVYKKTLGVDFLEKTVYIDAIGQEVQFHIWDTAGQEYYDNITKRYYKGMEDELIVVIGASVCILAFSTVDRNSFLNLEKWKAKVENECGRIPTVIVQNKIDLINEAKVTKEEVETLANRLNLTLIRTCVKSNMNVSQVFQILAEKYMNRDKNVAPTSSAISSIKDIKETSKPNYQGQNITVSKNPPPPNAPSQSMGDENKDGNVIAVSKTKKKDGGCIIF